jgi:opacity protein-like surface antigen
MALVLAAAGPAAAQAGKPPADNPGLMVRGLGGVTFTGATGGIFSGAVGAGVGHHVVIFGEFGRITNVIPGEIKDALDQLLTDEAGGSAISLNVKFPATYGLGGARFVIKTKGHVQPFIEAGGGVAHVTVSVALSIDGEDFSQELRDFLSENGDASLSTTQGLIMVGGGITFRMSAHTNVDVGYRLMHIITDVSTNSNAVYAALTWRR